MGSLLRSLSFGNYHGVSELPDEVLQLFMELVENPNRQIEFASEIIDAGLQGRIDLNSSFNLGAYEATIRKNGKLNLENRKKRELYIDQSDGDDWEDVSRSGGIKVDALQRDAVDEIADAYEKLILEDELQYAITTIKELQPILLIEEQVDLLHLLKQSLRFVPSAIEALRSLCSDYEVLAEQIKVVLESGRKFEELFTCC